MRKGKRETRRRGEVLSRSKRPPMPAGKKNEDDGSSVARHEEAAGGGGGRVEQEERRGGRGEGKEEETLRARVGGDGRDDHASADIHVLRAPIGKVGLRTPTHGSTGG